MRSPVGACQARQRPGLIPSPINSISETTAIAAVIVVSRLSLRWRLLATARREWGYISLKIGVKYMVKINGKNLPASRSRFGFSFCHGQLCCGPPRVILLKKTVLWKNKR
jgi:hypothetical protein